MIDEIDKTRIFRYICSIIVLLYSIIFLGAIVGIVYDLIPIESFKIVTLTLLFGIILQLIGVIDLLKKIETLEKEKR